MKTWTKGIMAGLVAGAVSLGSFPAVAGPYNSYINQQEIAQEHRIHEGLYSGRLSPGEFRRLENQQARIRATEARMRADGRLTRGEKTQLAQMQAHANRSIYRYKHNNYGPACYRPANCRPGYYRPVTYRPVNWRGGWR
jgi:hypothetical protein